MSTTEATTHPPARDPLQDPPRAIDGRALPLDAANVALALAPAARRVHKVAQALRNADPEWVPEDELEDVCQQVLFEWREARRIGSGAPAPDSDAACDELMEALDQLVAISATAAVAHHGTTGAGMPTETLLEHRRYTPVVLRLAEQFRARYGDFQTVHDRIQERQSAGGER